MELDKTTIVLRQRPLLDLIDLSLVVFRNYWQPLLVYSSIGVLPFMLINFFVLKSLSDYDTILVLDNQLLEELPLRIRYVSFLMGMVFIQAPLAFIGVTYYLGQVLFIKQPSFRELGETIAKILAGLVLILGVFRFGLLVWLVVALVPSDNYFNIWREVFLLGLVLCGSIISIRAVRPFAPEILLLEQPPLRSERKSKSGFSNSYQLRTRSLHRPLSGDLIGRSMGICLAIFLMLGSLTFGELFISGVFFGVWQWEWWMDTILFPLNLWLVALWATVFRFLSYLDCRTRLEGWELDLRLRAEARRLSGATDS